MMKSNCIIMNIESKRNNQIWLFENEEKTANGDKNHDR